MTKYIEASTEEIALSRLRLGNQYAYIDEHGGLSALSINPNFHADSTSYTSPEIVSLRDINPEPKERYSEIEIEQLVRRLHGKMWRKKSQIWSNVTPSNPIKILDPAAALKLIGYHFDLTETLGQFYSGGKTLEVAGTIDKKLKQVRISRQFSSNVRRFTAAHELGHAVLHKTSGLHRDRPVDGIALSRNSVEFEADKFATSFLMPQKLVRNTFKQIFLTGKFVLREETAFALGYSDYEALKNKCFSLRQLSKILASAERYNGLHFQSLANQFQVSTEAMAIRLEELNLLEIQK